MNVQMVFHTFLHHFFEYHIDPGITHPCCFTATRLWRVQWSLMQYGFFPLFIYYLQVIPGFQKFTQLCIFTLFYFLII